MRRGGDVVVTEWQWAASAIAALFTGVLLLLTLERWSALADGPPGALVTGSMVGLLSVGALLSLARIPYQRIWTVTPDCLIVERRWLSWVSGSRTTLAGPVIPSIEEVVEEGTDRYRVWRIWFCDGAQRRLGDPIVMRWKGSASAVLEAVQSELAQQQAVRLKARPLAGGPLTMQGT